MSKKIILKLNETPRIIFSITLSPVEYDRVAIFKVISVRVQKWIWSPRHNTPPLTVFINSHHCLADANQLPSEPCERVFLIGIAKKWACSERSSFHESFLRISAGHSARWQFSLPLISTSITKIAFLECFQFCSTIQQYIL